MEAIAIVTLHLKGDEKDAERVVDPDLALALVPDQILILIQRMKRPVGERVDPRSAIEKTKTGVLVGTAVVVAIAEAVVDMTLRNRDGLVHQHVLKMKSWMSRTIRWSWWRMIQSIMHVSVKQCDLNQELVHDHLRSSIRDEG